MKLLALPLLAASLSAHAGVDLTPVPATRHFHGSEISELRFSDNGKPVAYQLPQGWSYSSLGPAKIRFYPPQGAQASAEMEIVPLAEGSGFEEEFRKTLREQMLRSLPEDSEQIAIISEVMNPLMINGHQTWEVTISYVWLGQRRRLSTLIANLDGQQLRCRVSTQPQDFDQVHRLFQRSLCGLQWLTKTP